MLSGITSSTMLLSACFIFQIAFAQQNTNSPRQSASGSTTQVQRIVDECSATGGANSCAKVNMKTRIISIQVPEFKQGDENTHTYLVSGVDQDPCSGGTAKPDEYGFIEKAMAVTEVNADENKCQYYLMVMDNKTLEARVTLDLYQVKLVSFLISLEGAMQLGVRLVTKQRSASSVGSGLRDANRQYGEQHISIRGDNLTIDEVLDQVYQDTGCIVNRQAEGMVLASCP